MISECERIIQESFYKLNYTHERLIKRGIHGRILRFEMSQTTYRMLKDSISITRDDSQITLYGKTILINDELPRGQVNVLGVEA